MKTYFSYFLFLFFTAVLTYNGQSQDVHFSQFYATPATLNPATTGNFRGDYRVSFIYRRQYQAVVDLYEDGGEYHRGEVEPTNIDQRKPFKTFNIAFDIPIYLGEHKFGLGVKMLHDETGGVVLHSSEGQVERKLTTTQISGSLSYLKKVNGHKLAIGFQPSYISKKTGATGPPKQADTWMDKKESNEPPKWRMLEPSGSENEASPLENIPKDLINYFDFNAGVMWSKDFGKFEPVVGLAVYHIVNPKNSLIGDNKSRLRNRNVISFGGTYDLNTQLFLMPNVLFMIHRRAYDLVYGLNIGYNLEDVYLNKKIKFNYIYFGPQIRHSINNFDALILTIGANLKQWNVGLSRDITLSRLQTGTNSQNGAWEISVIFIKPETKLKKAAIPCERY
ncbi:MAG: PorP/SprF family type IX secretion system membrane protein [Flavobacteriales bacterium]|nr:PorP/SprF family type IX secretion system membrane protein [Flavobacteriales bacterium]PCH54219.1 MAG: hypothetical protein COC22_00695 [Flavobacteriaceae bacterium]